MLPAVPRIKLGQRNTPLQLEELVSDLSSAFVRITPHEVDAEIERWLRRLVEFLGVDRASTGQMSSDGHALHVTHSYAVEGVPTFPMVALDTELPWYLQQVRKGVVLRLEHLPEGLPAEARAERAYVAQTGFKSHLVLPFTVGGSTLGAMGFAVFREYRVWPDRLVKRLQLVAEVVGNALARKRARQALEEQLAFERLVTELVKTLAGASDNRLDDEVHNGLTRLVAHFGVDQCVLVRLPTQGFRLTTTHAAPRRWRPFLPDTVDFPWYVKELRKGRTLQLGRIPTDLPVEAAIERRHWRQAGLQAHLAVPLVAGDLTWGVIGFAALFKPRRWTDEEAQRLRLVGEIMMGALMRREADEAVGRRRDELAHVARVAALGELTAALAHELNQPLAAIRTNAQATRRLLAAGRRPDDLEEVLDDIVSDAARAGNLIVRLRALLARREVKKIALDVNQMIRDVQAIADAAVRQHGCGLVLRLAPHLRFVTGDAVQLQQVLLNVVRNAAEAMAGPPSTTRNVMVRTAGTGARQVAVAVEDGGPRIDDATLENMFAAFYTTKPTGLGMGLAISRSIIEAHHGRLWAERRARGGLTVKFVLPVIARRR